MIALALNPDRWLSHVATQRHAIDTLATKAVANVVSWAFSKTPVQLAFLKVISCRTPIGMALNDQINASLEGGDHDRAIESAIEDYMRQNDMNVDAEDIKDLDAAVSEIVSNDRDLVNAISDAVLEKIAEKISR